LALEKEKDDLTYSILFFELSGPTTDVWLDSMQYDKNIL